ncbi:putative MFS family arabinose efflux permease [Actinomycetospora succinea]|uniref:Putative MFS family arabinose efflux permease n=1 Tax=Actinomycetospora succinea TaxID=663603 RepID=A0A4R6VMD6_9PSEU|nr:MFS transporter [Actinomycetospora succinea]TDQ63099.1 putative MFS family arabinose efflux permease [Actinomycetospora succinea]
MSTAPAGTSPFRQPKAVWAVAFACVISFMGIGLVDPILPALATQLQASPAQVSLLFTSYLLITAVMMLVTGWVSSRIGAKATLVTGLTIIVVFAALAGASGSIGEIVGFRAGWGLGNALFIATSLAVIVASASGGFAGAIILYETALGVGIALGPLVGGLLGSVSWRAPFFGVAVLMAIALVATLVLLDKTPKPAKKISLLDPIKALRHRSLATIALTAFAYNWGFFTLLAYSPYSMGGLDELQLGAVFTAWGVLVAIFAVFVAPALERRFGTVRVLYFVLGLLAVDLAVIAFWNDTPGVVIGAVIVAGAMIGLNNTLVTQAVMSVAPVERPVASASYSFVRFLGGGLAPWIAGILAEAFLPDTPFWVGAVVVAVGILVLATAHRLLRRVETGEVEVAAEPASSEPGPRPVLVAVDGAPHAPAVAAAGGRLAKLLDAPLVVVHVPESAVVDAAAASDADGGLGLDRSVAAASEAAGADVTTETLVPIDSHDGVGGELVAVARRLDARAVVVGRPRGGALAALTSPSADRALWTDGPCPIIVVPDGAEPDRDARPTQRPAAGTPSVRGQVRDGEGRPRRAVVTLIDPDGHQLGRAEAGADGTYRLDVGPARPGTGLLLARGRDDAGGHAEPTVVPVALDGEVVHDVVLTTGTPVPAGH